ncbi:LOB domain-containing protein 38-like isoform X1 [Coffea arabica]|uniref:LOB domain-containing protein 38-like isoform X1 n=1 Tax=Coffea arabica TaxID=13443 RepID=A0A6P6UKW4_COFAR
MSCNGCRVLRRGCSDKCALRPCLGWIPTPQAQANATLFVSKFFGRSDLMSFITAVPDSKKPALFQSLLYEACGRTVNPVSGAVGLLSTGNWPVCEAAVETVLAGGTLRPVSGVGVLSPDSNEASEAFCNSGGLWRVQPPFFMHGSDGDEMMVEFESDQNMSASASFRSSEASDVWGSFGSCGIEGVGGKEPKLLNLFV